jgi:CopG family nickel-responsive transcriptional regulator
MSRQPSTDEARVPERTIRFTVSLPESLLRELDRRVTSKGYDSRSEAVREMIRERIVEDRWHDEGEEVVGVLTISYDHHERDLTQRMLDVQHSQYLKVLCSTHVHLDHHNCLETIILAGRPPEIERLSDEIATLRGVRFAELTRASKLDV